MTFGRMRPSVEKLRQFTKNRLAYDDGHATDVTSALSGAETVLDAAF